MAIGPLAFDLLVQDRALQDDCAQSPPANKPHHHRKASELSTLTFDEDSPWAKKNILCLDGGGVRGLSSIMLLRELMVKIKYYEEEEELSRLELDASSYTTPTQLPTRGETRNPTAQTTFLPCHYFDYISGTSTGGLIAIMLGRLRLSVDTALEKYKQLTMDALETPTSPLRRIFVPYDKKYRENIMRIIDQMPPPGQPSEQETKTEFRSDSFRCRTVVCALQSERNSNIRTPYLFRSYDHLTKSPKPFERNPGKATSFHIKDVARAVSMSPLYPNPVKLENSRFCDAGAVLNNPTWEIFEEVNQMHKESYNAVDLLLSLGSGTFTSKSPPASEKTWSSGLVSYTIGRDMRDLDRFFDAMIDTQMRKAAYKLNYYRFNADLGSGDTKFNRWKHLTFQQIESATRAYLRKIEQKMNECARKLVVRRRARAQTMQWESFAMGIRYRCTVPRCKFAKGGGNRPFADQNELFDHLRIEHGYPPPHSKNYDEIQTILQKGRTNSD